ncbi:hypothetical protein TRFO_19835 [Tritrichomonas foetus]|uniref:F5/8 type C domain-containing protein n=1 Tax=Tritrichomonas foetus TaxID=1144522 RepID=A0A1J4KLV1_9EUKA|nr:hypothetical protein TRFO_19835 [Tritrichomonas foetus]|eukprot:OHT10780.1 hypothetical protein TRFO_19835 [Tritrichomonas foetus]
MYKWPKLLSHKYNHFLCKIMKMLPNEGFSFSFIELTEHLRAETNLDFCINYNNHDYYVNKLVASTFSRKICEICINNCLATSLSISDDNGPFEEIVSVLKGNSANINSDNYLYILKMAVILKIDFLIMLVCETIENIDYTKIVDLFYLAFLNGCHIDPFLPIISQNMENLINNHLLENWPPELFDFIFRSTDISYPILPILEKFIEQNPNSRLRKYYPYSVNELNKSDVNINLFRNMLLREIPGETFPEYPKNTFIVEYSKENQFNGIFKKIIYPKISISNSIQSLHDSTFTDRHSPYNILNDHEYFYCSNTDKNQFIIFSFDENVEIYLNAYSIKTWEKASKGITPFSWQILVSNDFLDWTIVDERQNVSQMKKNNHSVTFHVQKAEQKCKIIKFLQLKNATESNNIIAIDQIEIFGRIIINK